MDRRTRIRWDRLGRWALLGVFAFVLYIPVTLLLATVAALFRARLPDAVISVITLVGLSLPEFVLGTLLIFTFAVEFSLAPALSIVNPDSIGQTESDRCFLALTNPSRGAVG